MDDLIQEFSEKFRRLLGVEKMSKLEMSLEKDDRCRLCLHRSSSSIETTDLVHHVFIQKVFKIFNLQIAAGGMLPTRVCLQCVNETEHFYRFFVKVLSSQDILQNELMKRKTADISLNDYKTSIVKIDQDIKFENHFRNYLVKIETDPVNEHKVLVIDPTTSLVTVDKEPNELSQLDISIPDNNSDHDAESVSDGASSDVQVLPAAVDSPFVRSEPKFTPIELFKNGRLVVKGRELSDELKKIFDLRCGVCYHHPEFDSVEDYFRHQKCVHDTEGFVTCCEVKFSAKRPLLIHVTKHVQPSALQCPVCKKTFTGSAALRNHLKTHLPDYIKEKSYICKYCNRKYSTKGNLNLHIKHAHSVSGKQPCTMCDKVFDSKHPLNYHINTDHKGQQQLCPICGRSFKTGHCLKRHLITHDENAKICCKECGFIASNKINLNRHILRKHTNDVFKCDKCGFFTKSKDSLIKHIRSRHTGSNKKIHQCSLCEKKFVTQWLLQSHFNNHTGERKFSCKYCPRTFVNNCNKFSHMKRMHKDQILEDKQKQQQVINAMLEKQLLEEKERIKNQEILILQAKEKYLAKEGSKEFSAKASDNEILN